ncbi:PREDICTED: DNA-directed RNA polymerase III subunit RPC4 [Trachymyrmex cornetzi]|uniref:DNA-directed RNA polymerase III subunit RPC4 n=1 Tax=Trachymyrmex cornetzi TaxID=471704 RepID=A0A195E6C1_9HYME|nr:PREDICTED: DNA-directed RNA polymerase III subunit RPC4 [Trachymyrmex cornetzi]KYN20750.1 DNA-directed RNA polymerase III subunit RPC4 [Trachymyrmex cornetzi]
MSSDNSVISNDTLHTNIRIKIEPGTSESEPNMSEPSTSALPSTSFSERVKSIKVEPGLPTTTQRLISYRLPRDLTLGGNIKVEKPKKVYTPNLNVQRNKKKDGPAISVKTDLVKPKNSDRGRERGRGDRGRGRGDKGNIIQSVGIWSDGLYVTPTARKSEGSRASSSTASTAKYSEEPKISTNKIKAEEDRKLKNLLRDDFIDDAPEIDEKMCPLTLPRIRKDIHDMIDNDKIDKKPVISENGEIINEEKSRQDKKEELTISQIIESKANSYTLIQFPESLPGLVSSREEAGSKQSNNSNTRSENDNKAKTEFCILNNLRSGLLGKLEILKSGKARLRFGEMSFFVDIGVQQRFQQDLLAVKIDASQTGELVNLGSVSNKLICSPDFESILENS